MFEKWLVLVPPRSVLVASAALLALVLWALTVHSQGDLQVGYAVIEATPDSLVPVSTALFSLRLNGVLVSEAGVAAVEPIRRGRLFVDATIPTGLALANPSGVEVAAVLTLRDSDGNLVGEDQIALPAGHHRAFFVTELQGLGTLRPGSVGSLSFESNSDEGLAALTIRQSTNAHQEPLLATLPVVELGSGGSEANSLESRSVAPSIIFPHLGAGGPLTTQIILINPVSEALRGRIRLTSSDGNPLELQLDGIAGSDFPYDLAPDGVFQATLTSDSGGFAGYATVTVEEGSGSPAGTAIFQFREPGGNLVSEAGVGAGLTTTLARIFVDNVDTQTGVAVASPGNPSAEVTFRLLDLTGRQLGVVRRILPEAGHLAVFADELFPDLTDRLTGVLEIASEVPFMPITLKLTVNERGDLILTTLPVADLTRPRPTGLLVFPQVGFGLGFTPRFILINADLENGAVGDLRLTQSSGIPLTTDLGGGTGSQFAYFAAAGGARRLSAEDTLEVAQIILDPNNPQGTEIVVNEGNTLALNPLVVDIDGNVRDDIPVEMFSLDPTAAMVNGSLLTGNAPGFSTLTVVAGGAVQATTVTVVRVVAGSSGFGVSGISADLAGRLYLTSRSRQTVLVARSLDDVPTVYAGTDGEAGFVDRAKLQSRFDSPRSIAFDQANGALYVADSENHVIRHVPLGEFDVESLAGSGDPGSQDGAGSAARFRKPLGVVLDGRGFLWVADTGNHTIRRVNLVTGMAKTMAGNAGVPGFADGTGQEARFDSPSSVAIARESLAAQLDRESRGQPPPALRVLVADRRNNALRIVNEDGTVETFRREREIPAPGFLKFLPLGQEETGFEDPRSVASDAAGNIFVSQGNGTVSTVLTTGAVVNAAEPGSFDEPEQLTVTGSGRIVVADGLNTGREVIFGSPEISSVTPSEIGTAGGERVTIQGRNFAPESIVVIDGQIVSDVLVQSTSTLVFSAPSLSSGLKTLTVLNRGGIAQSSIDVPPPSLGELLPGHITTVAGGGDFTGDGGPARDANLLVHCPISSRC